jgi:hypothetical protein
MTVLAAYYYTIDAATKRRHPDAKGLLRIQSITDGKVTPVEEQLVSGKVEARKVAAAARAKPWNF